MYKLCKIYFSINAILSNSAKLIVAKIVKKLKNNT